MTKNTALAIILVCFLLSACGSEPQESIPDWRDFSDEVEFIETPALDEIPVREANITLKIEDSDEYFFSHLMLIYADSRENIIVTDAMLRHFHYFSADGEYIQTLGGEGQGPGEFEDLRTLMFLSDDKIYFSDFIQSRLSEYHFSNGKWEFIRNIIMHDTEFFSITTYPIGSQYLMATRDLSRREQPQFKFHEREIIVDYRFYDSEFNPSTEIFYQVVSNRILEYRTRQGMGGANNISFSPTDHLSVGPSGHIFVGNSDSLAIQKLDSEENVLQTFEMDLPHQNFSEQVHQQVLDDTRGAHRRELSRLIGYELPIFRSFHVDEQERVWVRLYGMQENPNWLVFDAQGNPEFRFHIEGAYRTSHSVRNNKLYSIRVEDGVQSVVVHEVEG